MTEDNNGFVLNALRAPPTLAKSPRILHSRQSHLNLVQSKTYTPLKDLREAVLRMHDKQKKKHESTKNEKSWGVWNRLLKRGDEIADSIPGILCNAFRNPSNTPNLLLLQLQPSVKHAELELGDGQDSVELNFQLEHLIF